MPSDLAGRPFCRRRISGRARIKSGQTRDLRPPYFAAYPAVNRTACRGSGVRAGVGTPTVASGNGRRSRGGCAAVLCALATMALSGCSSSGGPGQLFVAPGTYDAYRCDDLTKEWATLNKREVELRANLDRAGQAAGGSLIGAAAYGTDYQTVLTQKKMVQQQAAVKNCEL